MADQRFYVYVVESPSSRDLLDRGLEGRVLTEALALSGIDFVYNVATDEETLVECLFTRFDETLQSDGYVRLPILHISAHGSNNGLQLTNKSFISWEVLKNRISAVNAMLGSTLIVCVSACYGSFAVRLAISDEASPFYALVGPSDNVALSDLAVAYSSFYHVLRKTWDLTVAHQAMVAASGNNTFQLHMGEQVRQGFKDWRLQQRTKDLLETLQKTQEQGSAEE